MNSSNILHADSFTAELATDSSTVRRPFESAGNGDLEAEIEALIAKNKDLVVEIASLPDMLAKKEQTRNALQEEVLENLRREEERIRFTEETPALSHELEAIASAKALEELRVSDLQAAIVALGVQLSNLTENGTCLRDQILVDQERLHQLEDIDVAMASQETDLRAVVKDLEGQLHAGRTGFDTEGQEPGEEVAIAGNLGAFEAEHMEEMAAAESNHNNLQFSSKVQEKDGEERAQRAEDLERRVAKLHGEVQALAHSNEDLKAILRQQESVIMDSAQIGDSKKLDCGDDEAGETAKSMQVKEAGSVFELQELTISSHNKQRSSSLMAPLLISGSTIVVVGLLVFLLHRRVKANSA